MNENNGTEANAPTIPTEDSEAKLARIEAEKAKLFEEKENYRKAYLKASAGGADEPEDERIKRLVDERIADSRLTELLREQDDLLRTTVKENKELKLAQLNKTGAPAAVIGGHSESTPVTDTMVTPEQMAYFKSQGWDEKKIEMYKKNLLRKR